MPPGHTGSHTGQAVLRVLGCWQGLPFIQQLQPRMSAAASKLGVLLAQALQAVLAREAPSARQHCLHAYAAVGDFAGAEQVGCFESIQDGTSPSQGPSWLSFLTCAASPAASRQLVLSGVTCHCSCMGSWTPCSACRAKEPMPAENPLQVIACAAP